MADLPSHRDAMEHRYSAPPPDLTPEAAEAYRRSEVARNLLHVVHTVCTKAGVPEQDGQGEAYTAAERVAMLQELGRHPHG